MSVSTLEGKPVSTTTTQPVESTPEVVQLTRAGVCLSDTEDEISLLHAQFEKNKWTRLVNFLDSDLLELIQRKVEESSFRVIDRSTGVELRPVDCIAYLATELLLNSPKLFRIIERITGCERIACFSGRIYRRPPAAEYFNRWHTDVTDESRLIALSINLSTGDYDGGALQIRSSTSHEMFAEVHNKGIGDAIIFLVDESLEHRVCRVEGTSAKTALAGWFRSRPDPASLFGRGNVGQ